MTIGNTLYSPMLSASIDYKNKLITAFLEYNTNKEPTLLSKFNGQNVQVVLVIEIPIL